MIKVMLIEDEPDIRRILKKMIEKQEMFVVVSEADSVMSAVRDFAKYRPEVVFVDVDLGGESGLDCAKMLTDLDPFIKIIFATAHNEYMANAFEIYAFDYLVKPFDMERLHQTLGRIAQAKEREGAQDTGIEQENIVRPKDHREKLMIKGREQMSLIDIREILLIERADHATRIVTDAGEYRTSAALSELEEKLPPADFMRCHKSYIINLHEITQIEPYGRWTFIVRLKGTQDTALITAQKYEELKKLFQ